MDFKKAAEKGSEKFASDLRNTLLKYVPIAALVMTFLAFVLNFGVISIASHAMPYDVVQLRAKALTDEVQKQADELRKENEILKKRIDEMQAQIDRLSSHK